MMLMQLYRQALLNDRSIKTRNDLAVEFSCDLESGDVHCGLVMPTIFFAYSELAVVAAFIKKWPRSSFDTALPGDFPSSTT